MRIHGMMCLLLSVSGIACASSQADQVRDARMEQIDAQTVARTRVIEERQDAREEAIEQNYDSAKTNVDNSKRGDKDAAQNMLETSEERALFQSKSVGRLETIRVRMDAARKKLEMAEPARRQQLSRELDAVEKEYQHMQQEVQAFPNAPEENWQASMEALDSQLTHLNTRVKSVTGFIEGE